MRIGWAALDEHSLPAMGSSWQRWQDASKEFFGISYRSTHRQSFDSEAVARIIWAASG
jgi:hypothetical protein